jgi:hypothetical protein
MTPAAMQEPQYSYADLGSQVFRRVRPSVRPLDSYRPPPIGADWQLSKLLEAQPLPGNGQYGCYRIADSSEYSDVARRVECCVFQEFFGNDPSVMTQEYAPYEEHSTFLLVVDRELQQPAGALRIIRPSDHGLKSLNDIEHAPLSIARQEAMQFHGIQNIQHCWDAGTLAVLKPYRGKSTAHIVSTMLYGLFYAELCNANVEHVVTILHGHAYKQLTEVLGIPFTPIAGSEPFYYLGAEDNRAAYLHVPDVRLRAEMHLNRVEPKLRPFLQPYFDLVVLGEGLPEVVEVA